MLSLQINTFSLLPISCNITSVFRDTENQNYLRQYYIIRIRLLASLSEHQIWDVSKSLPLFSSCTSSHKFFTQILVPYNLPAWKCMKESQTNNFNYQINSQLREPQTLITK